MNEPQEGKEKQENKVTEGPCSQQFAAVQKCGRDKGISEYKVSRAASLWLWLIVTRLTQYHRHRYKHVLQKQIS